MNLLSILLPFGSFELPFVSAKNMSLGSNAAQYLLGKRTNNPTDYYTQESVGTVYDPSGMLAEFGIQDGTVMSPEVFEKLCDAHDPLTSQPLLKQHGDQHRAGTDFAFAPPKSFSALWAVADEDMRKVLEEINRDAVRTGLDHLNEQAVTRLGKQGQDRVKSPFAAVSFQHGSNRDGEPQLHLHNAILNLTKVGGEWKTLEPRELFRWQTASDALYQAELISRLQKAFPRVTVTRSENGHSFEIDAVPDDLVQHWSGRRADMVKKAQEMGISIDDAGGMDRVNFVTRQAKGDVLEDPHVAWTEQAKEFGFGPEAAAMLAESEPINRPPMSQGEIQTRAQKALDALLETESVISDNHLHRAVAEAFYGDMGAAEIKQIVDDLKTGKLVLEQHDKVVYLGEIDGMQQYSTASMQATERRLHEVSGQLSRDGRHNIDKEHIEKAIDDLGYLSDEQKALVRHLCSDGSLKIGEGSAGSGKSTSTLAAANAFKAAGYQVQGLASSWSAAKILEHDAQISSRAIQGFLNDVRDGKQQLNAKTVLMIDEAGLNGSKDAERLVDAAKKSGAKVVFLGEESQLSPVSAGPAMSIMIDAAGAASLETIRRQKDEQERQMVADFRDGKSDLALEHLEREGRLSMHRNVNSAKNQLIRDWEEFTHKSPAKTTLIMAVKNADVRTLNDQVRKILRDRGELQGPDVSIKTKGGNKSQVATDFAVGDRIVLAKTDRDLDVTNNSRAQITDIKTGAKGGHIITAKLESGRQVEIDTLKFKDPESGGVAIRHGYASTAWSAQGATVDRSFVLGEGMDRRYGYVAMSRHREAATLYVNEGTLKGRLQEAKKEVTKEAVKEELAKQLHRKTTKPSTLDFEGDRFAKAQERAKKERDELMARLSQRSNPELEAALKEMDDKVQKALDEAEARRREEERRKAEEEARRAAEQQQSTLRVK